MSNSSYKYDHLPIDSLDKRTYVTYAIPEYIYEFFFVDWIRTIFCDELLEHAPT